MGGVAERLEPDDDAALDRLLAFAGEVGTARAATAREYRVLMTRSSHWVAVVVPGADAGTIAAAALASVQGEFDPEEMQVNAFARPGGAQDLASALDELDVWARERCVTRSTAHVSDPSDEDLTQWQAAGYERIGARTRMVREVTDADRDLPGGVAPPLEARALAEHPELEPSANAVWRDGIDDIPTALAFTTDDTLTIRSELGLEPGAPLPGSVLVAVEPDAGAVVAVAHLHVEPALPERGGHRMTAVARTHRGRGLARALKVELIRWAASHGVRELQASNDEGNVAMRRVNEALDYEPLHEIVLLRRPVR